jgi:transcription initiation factor TFIID subunit 12
MNPQQQNGGQPQAQQLMLKPEQVRQLQFLDDVKKKQYEDALVGLWSQIQSFPAGSQQAEAARLKIVGFSNQMRINHQKYQQKLNEQRQNAAQGAAQPGQANAAAQPGQTTAQSPPAQAQPPQAQQQAQAPAAGSGILPHVAEALNQFTFLLPPSMQAGSPQANTWLKEAKLRFGQALNKQEIMKANIQKLTVGLQKAQQSGKLSQQDLEKFTQQKNAMMAQYNESKNFVDIFKKQQADFKANQQTNQGQGQAAQASAASPQPMKNEGKSSDGYSAATIVWTAPILMCI